MGDAKTNRYRAEYHLISDRFNNSNICCVTLDSDYDSTVLLTKSLGVVQKCLDARR